MPTISKICAFLLIVSLSRVGAYQDTVMTQLGTCEGSVTFVGIDSVRMNQPKQVVFPRSLIREIRLERPNGQAPIPEALNGFHPIIAPTVARSTIVPEVEKPMIGFFGGYAASGGNWRNAFDTALGTNSPDIEGVGGFELIIHVGDARLVGIGLNFGGVFRVAHWQAGQREIRNEMVGSFRVGPILNFGSPTFHLTSAIEMDMLTAGNSEVIRPDSTYKYTLSTESSPATGYLRVGLEWFFHPNWGIAVSGYEQMGSMKVDGVNHGGDIGLECRLLFGVPIR